MNTYPEILSAKDLQEMGLSRPMVYRLLNRTDTPVIQIGRRKFMRRDLFVQWLDKQQIHSDDK